MRVTWNQYEVVPLDLGNDPPDYIVDIASPGGLQLTVKRTQINGAGEVWLTLNGRPGGSGVTPEVLIIGNYALRCYSYEDDSKPSYEVPILSYVLKGKTLRLTVDISL